MATVDDLRNEIREAVGRHERIESTGFTKEALAAICTALTDEQLTKPVPPKSEMRSTIRQSIDGLDSDADGPFRKADLEAIAAELGTASASD